MSAQSRLFCDPMDCSPPGSSVHGIFWQEYYSGLPFLTPRDLPDPGIESMFLVSPASAGKLFYHLATWESLKKDSVDIL